MILIRLVLLPFRVAFGATGMSFRLGYRTGRLLGYRRLFVFGLGIGIGLLIAPVPGAQLRARLRERLEGGVGESGSGTGLDTYSATPAADLRDPTPIGTPGTAAQT